jgi:hypothetical protein
LSAAKPAAGRTARGFPRNDNPSVYNTTEEAPAWAYEMARVDGQMAGIATRLEAIEGLTARDVHTLVLPPLYDLSDAQRTAIRRLHEQGVGLLAFEVVPGLEDLFGVTETAVPETGLRNIQVNADLPNNPLLELAGLTEYTETVDHPMRYAAAGAQVLLQGEAPVLFLHQTRWGKSALYNLPPTLVRRDALDARFGEGAESVSELINASARLVLRALGTPEVETSEGKLIAFRAQDDTVVVIVEEDAFPQAPRTIHPKIGIRLPGVRAADIACDREYSVVTSAPDVVSVRVVLNEHESAVLKIKPAPQRENPS